VNKRIKETQKKKNNNNNKREKKMRARESHMSVYEIFFSFHLLNQIVLFEVQLKYCVFNSSKHKADILSIYLEIKKGNLIKIQFQTFATQGKDENIVLIEEHSINNSTARLNLFINSSRTTAQV
jgi:hypothetical protein